VAFAQVKFFQTWKIAAFLVAFFSSFFSYSIDFSTLESKSPKLEGYFEKDAASVDPLTHCSTLITESDQYRNLEAVLKNTISTSTTKSKEYRCEYDVYGTYQCPVGEYCTFNGRGWIANTFYVDYHLEYTEICPPDSFPEFNLSNSSTGSLRCYNPSVLQDEIDEKNQLDKNDDYCKGLSMDSGNNTSDTVCYSAPNGSQCSMSKQSGDNYTYYSGTGTETLGCGSSENPPYDSSGTGSEKDDCIFSNGTNFCKANEDKHCKTIDGIKICDSGCIDSENGLFCDASQHEDVGEGESDYFSDNGTCSVVHASSSKGACEDFGGVWDENGADWIETSCPTGSGTCSTGSSFCGSCMDEGGIWTPDPINIQTERDGINDVAVRIEKSNEKLSAIEMTTRKTNEALISATKSGDGKLLAAIEELTKLTKDNNKFLGVKSEEKEEKETFTTITNDTDNSAITALFNDASKLALEAEIDQLKLDTTAFINNARVEATSLMTITIPNSVGYEVRNLTLTAGTFDVSLSRFSSFFILLSGPIMLLCSIISGFILLGGKD